LTGYVSAERAREEAEVVVSVHPWVVDAVLGGVKTWEVCGDDLGLTQEELETYLDGEEGTAIQVRNPGKIFSPYFPEIEAATSDPFGVGLDFFDVQHPPQNFQYLQEVERRG